MDIVSILIGVLLGAGAMYVFLQNRTNGISESDLQERYVVRELHNTIVAQNMQLQERLQACNRELRETQISLAAKEQLLYNTQERLFQQKDEIAKQQQQLTREFEALANRILEEKSVRFSSQNQQQLTHIVEPLKERLRDFEERADRMAQTEQTERISLRKEIEHLRVLNQQISGDALALANALKGDSKTQGDWGEFRLEMLLEKAGLLPEIHYRKQPSFKDETGADKRPDFIVNLPEGKCLVVDSKVSLTAYEKYFNATDDLERDRQIRAHTESLRRHIRDLSGKKYQQLYQIKSPDFVLLFVPIEPAFSLALQNDPTLLTEAIEKNVILVTTSTLLATLRTVAFIWKQEKQKQNVIEIARQSGKLYDKLVAFVEDLQSIGKQLDQAQTAYHAAFNKLSDSKKFGDTLLGRAEKIRELGASTTKKLPNDLIGE